MFQLIHGRISAEIHGEQGRLEAEDHHHSLVGAHLSEMEVVVEEVAHRHLEEADLQ